MAWLQENWIVAVVIAVVIIAILWWLLARRKPEAIAPPAEPARPAKPLEPVKPEIIAAEPARFKPLEPAPAAPPTAPPVAEPAPVAAPPTAPVAAPVAEPEPAPAPPPAPVSVAKPAPAPAPAPTPTKPVAAAQADNLQLLKGVGPKLAALLTGLGITRFDQVAAWTDADIAAIDPQLGNFQGRIVRDNWIDQAGYLARGDKTGFEAKYGALGGEL